MNNELTNVQENRNPVERKLYSLAVSGSVDAIKELHVVNYRNKYERMIDEMDEDNI